MNEVHASRIFNKTPENQQRHLMMLCNTPETIVPVLKDHIYRYNLQISWTFIHNILLIQNFYVRLKILRATIHKDI